MLYYYDNSVVSNFMETWGADGMHSGIPTRLRKIRVTVGSNPSVADSKSSTRISRGRQSEHAEGRDDIHRNVKGVVRQNAKGSNERMSST